SRTHLGRHLLVLSTRRTRFVPAADPVVCCFGADVLFRALGTDRRCATSLYLQRLLRGVPGPAVLPRVHLACPRLRTDLLVAVVGRYHARALPSGLVRVGT